MTSLKKRKRKLLRFNRYWDHYTFVARAIVTPGWERAWNDWAGEKNRRLNRRRMREEREARQ